MPIEPAAMKDRQVIEWDKDDIDALKFMKVDCLALGMMSCMKRGLDLLKLHKGVGLRPRHHSGRRSAHLRHDPQGRHAGGFFRSRAWRRWPCCRGSSREPSMTW